MAPDRIEPQRRNDRILLLLGGPPGVGKTTVVRLLTESLPWAGMVDADDVWHNPAATGDRARLGIATVASAMRRHFEAGCRLGILSWVFARAELYQPILDDLADIVDRSHLLYLVASSDALEQRLLARGDPEKVDFSISRLDLIRQLPFRKIDTTFHSPAVTLARILEEVGRWETMDT